MCGISHLVLVCLECLGLVCCEHGACLCKQGVLTWSFYHGFIFFSCSSYSTERIQELLQEGGEVKRRRERFQRQASMLSRLTRQLNFQEARASGFGDSGGHSGSLSNMAQSEDWRVAFEEAGSPSSSRSSNSPAQSFRGARGGVRGASPMRRESPIRGASVMNGQAYSATQYYNNDSEENGDIGSRRTPSRGPPPPPPPSGARV
jgi:dynamin GTPase